MKVIKITLAGEQFKKLVQGDTVRILETAGDLKVLGTIDETVEEIIEIEISLSDIGFSIIEEYVRAAKIEKNFGV